MAVIAESHGKNWHSRNGMAMTATEISLSVLAF